MGDAVKIRRLFRQSLPLFSALGDPVRQQLLLAMMSGEEKTVTELTAGTSLSRPTVSFHLKVLKEAGIIISHKRGRNRYYYPRTGRYFHVMKELVDEVDKVLQKEEIR